MDPNAQQPAQPVQTAPQPPVQPQPATPNIPMGNATPPTVTQAPAPTAEHKSSKAGLLLAILAIIVIALGGVLLYQFYKNKSANKLTQNVYNVQSQISPTAVPVLSPTLAPVKSGDAQIDQQSNTIDANMNNLNADINNVDMGLKDQQGNLN